MTMNYFKFAGSILKGECLGKFKLNDGSKAYKFKDKNGYIYTVNKQDICGNLKQ
jgi:hypothetical protein